MAKVKATVSFAGKISMSAGEVGEIADKAVLSDLLLAGYVEELSEKKADAPKSPAKNKKGE